MDNKKKVTSSNQPIMGSRPITYAPTHKTGQPVANTKRASSAPTKPHSTAQRVVRTNATPINRPATPVSNPAKPDANPESKTETVSKEKKPKNKKPLIFIAIGVVAILAIVGVIVAINVSQGSNTDAGTDESADTSSSAPATTEEENKVTKETTDNYAQVSFEGYQQVEDEMGSHGAIIVTVKNISDKKTCIAVDLVAKDADGNILDQSSLYAEGIEPEQVQTFQTFVYSELSPEQLQSAKIEVLKAYTYSNDPSDTTEQSEAVEVEIPQQ